MPDARTEILARIRAQTPDPKGTMRGYDDVPRRYLQLGSLESSARKTLLLSRLVDYDAEVIEVQLSTIGTVVSQVLAKHEESVLLVPPAVPDAWLPREIEVIRDTEPPAPPLAVAALNRAQAVLTPCAGAIAQTGTLLLAHERNQGRRVLSLVPDHHVCVLRAEQIVETVSEGLALLEQSRTLPLTTISGPSATADIEMTRIRGVHGPRRLTVLLLSDNS